MTRSELERHMREEHLLYKWRQGASLDDLDFDPEPAPAPAPLPDDNLLTQREVLEYVPWDRTTLWRKTRDGLFPKPFRLAGSRRIVWRKSTVLNWINEQC